MDKVFIAVELACDGPCRFRVAENAINTPLELKDGPIRDLQTALTLLTLPGQGPCNPWYTKDAGWLELVSVGVVVYNPNSPELCAIVRDACGFWWGIFEREATQ